MGWCRPMRILLWLLILSIIIFQVSLALFDIPIFAKPKQIKVGLIFSKKGFRSSKEILSENATLLAIEEINNAGGIQGNRLIPISIDPESDWDKTLKAIEILSNDYQIDVIFGGWISKDYNEVSKILEKNNALLFTPYQVEGIIESDRIIFMGTTPNQQVPPAINFCLEKFGTTFTFIGSNNPYTKIANVMMNDIINAHEGKILGEFIISDPINNSIEKAVKEIKKNPPKVILNTLTSTHTVEFFRVLREFSLKDVPVISFCIGGALQNRIENIDDFEGSYTIWNYFQNLETEDNALFVKNYIKFSDTNIIDNAAESAYASVYIWKKAIEDFGHIDPLNVLQSLRNITFHAPEGLITMTMKGNYAWRYSRIGQMKPKNEVQIIWQSSDPIRPYPYYTIRTQQDWNDMLKFFYSDFTGYNE